MIVHLCQQRTEEWFALRCGKFTASNFDKLFMKPSTAGYQNLINTVVYERLTGDTPDSYSSEWMQRGNDLEGEALQRYELETFNKTHLVGLVEMNEWIGCSPDALVGDDGLAQIKCPKHNTAIYYALNLQKAVEEFSSQMQGELWITERKWNDLCIYHPKLEPLIIRVQRDENTIECLKNELAKAIEEAKQRINKIKGIN